MTATHNEMPFTVRLQDGREFAPTAKDAEQAIRMAETDGGQGTRDPRNPTVMCIRADEPFVRAKPKRHWLLRLLIGRE